MSHLLHIVTKDEQGVRIDKLLVELNKSYSRHQIQKWIKDGIVQVNNKNVKTNYKCKVKDQIEWEISQIEPLSIKPQQIALDIVYEDDDLIVINKPKGMLAHPTLKEKSNTLVNALKYYTKNLSNVAGKERLGIVHRLDQYTSGLIVIAKNNEAHIHLKKQFQKRSVIRIYEAIVYGKLNHEHGVIKAPIGRNPKNRLKMAVVPDGKEAQTYFKVLQYYTNYTHIECELVTGRTHQIRVHMNYLGHPIVGDPLYSRRKTNIINNQALFAKKLSFIHPKTKEQLSFSIQRPKDFKNLLQLLKNKS